VTGRDHFRLATRQFHRQSTRSEYIQQMIRGAFVDVGWVDDEAVPGITQNPRPVWGTRGQDQFGECVFDDLPPDRAALNATRGNTTNVTTTLHHGLRNAPG
jgi:hypothetical protein